MSFDAEVIASLNDVVMNYDLKNYEGFLFCLFEAISNALYSSIDNTDIKIKINFTRQYKANEINEDKDNYIKSFAITDNGIGFADKNFDCFTRKIYKTTHDFGRGTGRITFLKVFEDVSVDSYFKENSKVFHRSFIFSTSEIKDSREQYEGNCNIGSTILFNNIKEKYQKHTKNDIGHYCEEILNHFYVFLYYLKEKNQAFEIKLTDDSGKVSERIINTEKLKDDKVKKENFSITDTSELPGIDGKVDFEILHIKTNNTKDNKASYVVDERAAGEIKGINLPPSILEDKDKFRYYYNVYLRSSYLDRFLNDSRTQLSIPTSKDSPNSFITSDKIEEELKKRVDEFLSYEIGILKKKSEDKVRNTLNSDDNNRISSNKSYLYLLADEATKKMLLNKIKYKDSETEILSKIKNFHEELQAKTIEKINDLVEKIKDVKGDVDLRKLEEEMNALSMKVNIENSVNLSSYIMYRKYVLNLFDNALQSYKNNEKQNEALFHNLLLPKKTSNNINSNLWLLDDLFLYFEGASEQSITDIKIKGEKIIRELSEEEKQQLREFGKNRLNKRIDLLFFPEEKKCVIIELKDPKIGVTDNATQMDKYAQLLANFVKPEFSIDHFSTYLITDNFNKYDKPSNGYRKIHNIDGFVRNSADIKSFDSDLTIADQYSEIIKYSDIYKRANRRNEIFFNKLGIIK